MPGREEGVRALPTEGFVPAGQELLTNDLGSDSFAQRLRAESDPVGRLVLLRNELSRVMEIINNSLKPRIIDMALNGAYDLKRLGEDTELRGRISEARYQGMIGEANGRLNTAIVIWDALWERSELDEILRTSVLLRETPDPSH